MKYFVAEDEPGTIVSALRETPEEPYYEWWNPRSKRWEYNSYPFSKMWAGDPDYRSATEAEVTEFINARTVS